MLLEHYNAARHDAVIVVQDWMGLIRLTGPDRQSWLQSMVTNDVRNLSPGSGCYAGHLNAQGRLVAQMTVLAAEEEFLLLVERAATAKLVAAFDKLIIMEDVQPADVSEEFSVLGLYGPKAPQILESLNAAPDSGGLYTHRMAGDSRLVRGDLGLDLLIKRSAQARVLGDLTAAGAVPSDRELWNILRTERGLPLYGVDVDESTIMPELGQRGISYDKGCYVGQEVVAKIRYIGHVNRRFVGLVCDGDQAPAAHSKIEVKGKEAGYVTTGVFSPGVGRPIALGFLNRTAAEPGTVVDVVLSGGRIRAQVTAFPFANAPAA